MTLSSTATADRIYATGLRNQWHPVVPSRFVAPGAMRKVTALGEQWLLFRRSDGTLSMLADRCPHRGAPCRSAGTSATEWPAGTTASRSAPTAR